MNNQTELQKEIFNYLLDNGFTYYEEDERFFLNPFYWADRQDILLGEDGLFEYALGRKIQFLDTETYVSVRSHPINSRLRELYCLEFWDREEDEIAALVAIDSKMEKATRILLLERFVLAVVEQAKLFSAFMAICNE